MKHSCISSIVGILLLCDCLVGRQTSDYPLSNNPDDIKFYLYPSQGIEQEIVYNNAASLANASFKYNAKTVFLVHGFTSDGKGRFVSDLLPSYINSGLGYNYIVVDWGLLAANKTFSNPIQAVEMYTKVAGQNIPIVSQRFTQFLIFLGADPSSVHIIGHSLGAHIGGNSGELYQTLTGDKQISRITGLDPAGPLFSIPFIYPRLSKKNAEFVDIIHTNMGFFGDISFDGHADFYPNGGIIQPGCDISPDPSCSHNYATRLYAASITKKFPACKCTLSDVVAGKISLLTGIQLQNCLDSCTSNEMDTVLLGEYCPSSARGFYSLRTTL